MLSRLGTMFFAGLFSINAWSANSPSQTADKMSASERKVDILAYHEAGLPDPTVIYVYGVDGKLIRVFGADGNNGHDGMQKMKSSIASGDVEVVDGDKPLGEKFQDFLVGQGLRLKNFINDKHKYTLILLVPDTNGAPCPPCENYRAMLASATTSPSAIAKFSVYTLKLGAVGQKFRVVK